MGGEEHRRLPGLVASTDDVDIQAVRAHRLAARRAVGDAFPGEPIESLDRQVPPRDAAREDDRPPPQNVTAVEVQLTSRGIDACNRPGHKDLRTEPPRLLQRTARELVAGHT